MQRYTFFFTHPIVHVLVIGPNLSYVDILYIESYAKLKLDFRFLGTILIVGDLVLL